MCFKVIRCQRKLSVIIETTCFAFRPAQECQQIFKAKHPMDGEQCKTKILGFGFSILEGVDPNKDNFVCASILHTRDAQIGCLMRLEPNTQAQVAYAQLLN